jgi:dUTP pyrophosphatase
MLKPVNIKVQRLTDEAILPKYLHKHDAGMDVSAIEDHVIEAGDRACIATGLSFELPNYCQIEVRPRSGLAIKHGITVLNTPGTVDSNYRGELGVILINLSKEAFAIKKGDRIAQIVVTPFYTANLIESDELEESDRGSGGFGSTGVR